MTHYTLKKLAEQSYTGNTLNEEIVNKIAVQLSRKDLKNYIKLLKAIESKKEVYITSAAKLTDSDLKRIQSLFPDKKLMCVIDSTMISGIKIVENDEEYEINLNRTFHDIINFLSKND
jgi:F0F1-type ATP synthase delta subunit